MAWIASRARKAEMMDKERMVPEKKKWQLGSTKGLEKFSNKKNAPAFEKDSEMGQLHLEYDAHDSDLQEEEKEEI